MLLSLSFSLSLITQSELQTSIILEGLVPLCCDWLDITSGWCNTPRTGWCVGHGEGVREEGEGVGGLSTEWWEKEGGGYWAEELPLSVSLACSQWMCMCSHHRKPLIPKHTAVLWRRREIIKTVSIGPHLKARDKLCCACCRVYSQQLCVLGIHTQSRNGIFGGLKFNH